MAQASVRSLLSEHWPADQLRDRWQDDAIAPTPCWSRLARAGVLGLRVPAAHGGAGLDETDLVLILEETGRAALPDPVVEVAAVVAPLLAEAGGHDAVLADIARGSCLVTAGLTGAGPFVADADVASRCLLQAGDQLHLVDRADYQTVRVPSVDGARRLFDVRWTPRPATRLTTGAPAGAVTALAFDRGCLGVSAQLVGNAERLITMTADHARTREQFGRPIGSFQAVKHELANALIALEFARPLVYRAAWSVATAAPARSRDVSMAKACASDAAQLAARTALQVHGAIGYTWEHDLHLWMKRVWALASTWGSAAWHRERVASAVLPAAG